MSWLRSGAKYFERDIRSVSAFFSGLISTVQFIRKVQVLCDAKTLIAPAWADLCQYLDTQLHLKEFIIKIDLHETYKPLRLSEAGVSLHFDAIYLLGVAVPTRQQPGAGARREIQGLLGENWINNAVAYMPFEVSNPESGVSNDDVEPMAPERKRMVNG
ncbi:hypothetical protein MMC29_001623 [Sticta canariensis]|nr:hypothetical protein [Sticta canariensis]